MSTEQLSRHAIVVTALAFVILAVVAIIREIASSVPAQLMIEMQGAK